MNEVLGDADPPSRGRRSVNDSPPFGDLDDGYGDLDDGFEAEPGPVRQLVARVATAESLAVASVVIATASWLDLPAVGNATGLLSMSHSYTPTYSGRVGAVGQIIVAVIGVILAIAGRRRAARDEGGPAEQSASAQPRVTWVSHLCGAALIIGVLSIVLAVVDFVIAGTAHAPTSDSFQTVQGLAAGFSGGFPWSPR